MEWNIPGTVLTCQKEEAHSLRARFEGMFLGGDIALSQVVAITGLEAHTIQNWVKRGFVTSPKNKRYTLRQLCRLLNIHALQGSMSLDKICALLGYVIGRLDDEGDDIIDDTELYFLFLSLAVKTDTLLQSQDRKKLLSEAMESYNPPRLEDKERVGKALGVMLTSYLAAQLQQKAEQMLHTILNKEK